MPNNAGNPRVINDFQRTEGKANGASHLLPQDSHKSIRDQHGYHNFATLATNENHIQVYGTDGRLDWAEERPDVDI
jgi:hypothetical protein